MAKEISVPALFQIGYYWEAKIFLVSVKLDLYTALAGGAKTSEALAQSLQTDADMTCRLLDALVVMGLLERDGESYRNTAVVAEFLVKSSPFYMGELMLLQDAEWEAWGNLEEIIRSGKPPISGNLFMNCPDLAEYTLKVLYRMGQRIAPSLVEKVDLSAYHSLLDVGGGAGTFCIPFCKRYPQLQAVLFDLPQTLTIAQKYIAREKMEDRIRLVGGDFNKDPFPGTYDIVFLSDILHYQTDAENGALFQKIYKSLNPGGILLVKDMFLGDENPGWNAIFSMHLMVYTEKGRCFKGSAVLAWLERAGFCEIREEERNMLWIARK